MITSSWSEHIMYLRIMKVLVRHLILFLLSFIASLIVALAFEKGFNLSKNKGYTILIVLTIYFFYKYYHKINKK